VEHELGVDGECAREAEGGRVVLAVVCELGHQPDQHPVDPPQNVERLLLEKRKEKKRGRNGGFELELRISIRSIHRNMSNASC